MSLLSSLSTLSSSSSSSSSSSLSTSQAPATTSKPSSTTVSTMTATTTTTTGSHFGDLAHGGVSALLKNTPARQLLHDTARLSALRGFASFLTDDELLQLDPVLWPHILDKPTINRLIASSHSLSVLATSSASTSSTSSFSTDSTLVSTTSATAALPSTTRAAPSRWIASSSSSFSRVLSTKGAYTADEWRMLFLAKHGREPDHEEANETVTSSSSTSLLLRRKRKRQGTSSLEESTDLSRAQRRQRQPRVHDLPSTLQARLASEQVARIATLALTTPVTSPSTSTTTTSTTAIPPNPSATSVQPTCSILTRSLFAFAARGHHRDRERERSSSVPPRRGYLDPATSARSITICPPSGWCASNASLCMASSSSSAHGTHAQSRSRCSCDDFIVDCPNRVRISYVRAPIVTESSAVASSSAAALLSATATTTTTTAQLFAPNVEERMSARAHSHLLRTLPNDVPLRAHLARLLALLPRADRRRLRSRLRDGHTQQLQQHRRHSKADLVFHLFGQRIFFLAGADALAHPLPHVCRAFFTMSTEHELWQRVFAATFGATLPLAHDVTPLARLRFVVQLCEFYRTAQTVGEFPSRPLAWRR